MRRYHGVFSLPMLSVVVMSLGCQNTLTIRVQRALVPSSLHLRHSSRLGVQLDTAIVNLNSLMSTCEAMDRTLDDWVKGFPEGEYREAAQNNTKFWREDLRDVASGESKPEEPTAIELRNECASYYSLVDITAHVDHIRETLRQVDKYLTYRVPLLQNWIDQAKTTQMLSGVARKFDLKMQEIEKADDQATARDAKDKREQGSAQEKLRTLMQEKQGESLAQIEVRAAQAAKKRFGGFVATDVYLVNPSDPKYVDILKTRGPWHSLFKEVFWQDVSAESFTKASAGVTGDSAIMFVMEHPGQVRMYQVSLDPTQITSNIGMLVSKAAAAGAKYMSAGVAP